MDEQGEPLPGGFVNQVIRVGDTVRRSVPPTAPFVRRVLARLAEAGWPGAPRFLGEDGDGREVLTFIEGHVAWEGVQPPEVSSPASLVRVARLVREFHDLTAGTELAGDQEVVCHGDLSPKNTVYRDLGEGLRPVAFLDWDLAAPGPRVFDLGHVCWTYLALGPAVADPAEAARMVAVLAEAYGLLDRRALPGAIAGAQERCWRGIEAEAEAGVPHAVLLRATGVARQVRDCHEWTVRQLPLIQATLG